jgi:hypothetical protein
MAVPEALWIGAGIGALLIATIICTLNVPVPLTLWTTIRDVLFLLFLLYLFVAFLVVGVKELMREVTRGGRR